MNKKLNYQLFLNYFIIILFILTTINGQQNFHTSDTSSLKMDSLRKVFGIWGRLLNRMAQQNPPTDDELHLKGSQEGIEENDNFIAESDWNKRISGKGNENKKLVNTGANRIINEARLNQLLPRLNIQGTTIASKKLLKTTTPLTTTEKQYLFLFKIWVYTIPTTNSKLENTTNYTQNEKIQENLEKLLKEDEKLLIPSPLSVNQSESVKLNENELIGLVKMENETAQLIAAIENVLADAEVGPNASGYWLHETSSILTTTTPISTSTLNSNETKITINTTNYKNEKLVQEIKENIITQKTENEEDKEDEEEEEESEEEEETTEENEVENKKKLFENKSTTLIINEFNNLTTTKINKIEEENTTKTTSSLITKIPSLFEKSLKKKGSIKFIPEAEEEEQVADIASLQLDSISSPVLPKSSNISSIKTFASLTETSKTVVPNIFNLQPNNSTAPNFSTMIKPVNSIIDGIGPLILPLIGYSRQALDSYSVTNNLLPGVPLRQQNEIRSSPINQQRQQQQQKSIIEEILSRSFASPFFPSPFITQQNEEQQKSLLVSEPPSLELLDKIVEQRRQRENTANELMMKRIKENNIIPLNNQNKLILTSTISNIINFQSSDNESDDSGRRVVLNNFHEDSGLIRKNEQIQQQQIEENQEIPPPSAQLPQIFCLKINKN
ncbi:hypothetical protein Mgra_00000932 [Meloidogyne graminicola]|uniref:Uncharacterized protein n=1 Tax=Meloidogyne graminicola TaxID=189291 RepID=A0A8T0A2J7_9BILA|nr:hypothetical protein Mgra_00000932 [Meloidogyne graminicola]